MISEWLIRFVFLVVGLIAGHYLTGYFRKKGENRADREDTRGITHEQESVKSTFERQTTAHKAVTETEIEILKDIYAKLDAYITSHSKMLPRNPDGSFTQNRAVLNRFALECLSALNELETVTSASEPFYSETVKQALETLVIEARTELIMASSTDFNEEWLKFGVSRIPRLVKVQGQVKDAIRKRLAELQGS